MKSRFAFLLAFTFLSGCFETSSNVTAPSAASNVPTVSSPPEIEVKDFSSYMSQISNFVKSGDISAAFNVLQNIEVEDSLNENDSKIVAKGLKEMLDQGISTVDKEDQRQLFARSFNQITKYEKDLDQQEQVVRKAYTAAQDDLNKQFIYLYSLRENPELESHLTDLKTN